MATDRQRLLGFARALLGNGEDAEDAVQDTYMRALASSEASRQAAWMHTVLRHVAIDRLRRRRLERTEAGTSLGEPCTDASDLESECEAALHHLLGRVSAVEAAVMLLRDVFEFDFGEIAPLLGRSETAIRQLLHRARVRSRRAESDAEVDVCQVALCWRAIESRDPEPLLGLLQITTACAPTAGPPSNPRLCRSSTRLVQVNGRYALALILDGVVLCIVPVGVAGALVGEPARAD